MPEQTIEYRGQQFYRERINGRERWLHAGDDMRETVFRAAATPAPDRRVYRRTFSEVNSPHVCRKLRRIARANGKPKRRVRRQDRNAAALLRFFRRRGDNARVAAEQARQARRLEEQQHRRPDQRRGVFGALAGFIRSFRRGGNRG